MNGLTSIALLSVLIYSGSAFAQIGEPVKKFTRSKTVKDFAFTLDSTLDTGPFSTTPGQEKRIYKSKDNRYTIEVIADKAGTKVILEELSFPLSENHVADDERCVMEFMNAATADKVNNENILKLYNEARQSKGKKLKIVEGGFTVFIELYHHALYRELNVTVTK